MGGGTGCTSTPFPQFHSFFLTPFSQPSPFYHTYTHRLLITFVFCKSRSPLPPSSGIRIHAGLQFVQKFHAVHHLHPCIFYTPTPERASHPVAPKVIHCHGLFTALPGEGDSGWRTVVIRPARFGWQHLFACHCYRFYFIIITQSLVITSTSPFPTFFHHSFGAS